MKMHAAAIAPRTVRHVHLAAQGLAEPVRFRPKKQDLLVAIRRMGALQIDTISVVARSPYFVLWSRLGSYDPAWLDQLLSEGEIFEYWSHAACFLPIDDIHLYTPFMKLRSARYEKWLRDNAEIVTRVLNTIDDRGEVRSSDFARGEGKSGWWEWKPEKIALENLFACGKLMIARRDGFQRVYALPETILRGRVVEPLSIEQARRMLVLKSINALGIARQDWIADYFRLKRGNLPGIVKQAVKNGEITEVEVKGWNTLAYAKTETVDDMVLTNGRLPPPRRTTLLSPFDPVVWDRGRALELFDFHYRIEVYTPRSKRQYGYFVLPILHRDSVVGRLDAKAHRREGRFEVRAIHFENGVKVRAGLINGLARAIKDCASWHRTPTVSLSFCEPSEITAALRLAMPEFDVSDVSKAEL